MTGDHLLFLFSLLITLNALYLIAMVLTKDIHDPMVPGLPFLWVVVEEDSEDDE